MNYLCARQRQSDGRWDYSQRNDGRIWPIGYCAGWRDFSPEEHQRFFMTDFWYADYLSRKDQYHEDGHATSEEACECYKKYELDSSLRFSEMSNQKRPCEVCQEWTQKIAMVGGYSHFVLCETHANRAEVERLFSVGESWES